MARSTTKPFRTYWIAAALFGLLAVMAIVAGTPFIAPLAAALGLFAGFIAWISTRDAREIAVTHAALQALTRGRFEEVERLHASVPLRARRGQVGRALAIQRAMIALYRGQPERTIAELEDAVAPRGSILEKSHLSLQRAHALGLRALAHASLGNDAQAEADAALAESIPEADSGATGRVALARAIVLSRGGAGDALAKHLTTHASLMLETAQPRERILVRALRRLARSRTRSIYREAAKPTDDDVSSGAVADWVARIAPNAAEHAGAERFADTLPAATMPEVSAAGTTAIAAARSDAVKDAKKQNVRRVGKRLLIAIPISLPISALVVWKLFEPAEAVVDDPVAHAPGHWNPGLAEGSLLGLAFLALATASIAYRVWQMRRANVPLLAANRAVAKGDDDEAIRLMTPLVAKSGVIQSAAARITLAMIAERRADFSRALDEAGRAYVPFASGTLRAYGLVHLVPSILAIRAVSLAALGRAEEARAELATILREHRDWANTAVTDFCVRLVLAVRSNDGDAASIARGRTAELPLPMRYDVLCDLVLATSGEAFSDDDRERLAGELDDDARLRAWVDAIAPGMRDRFAASRAAPRTRVAVGESDTEEEEGLLVAPSARVSKMTLPRPS